MYTLLKPGGSGVGSPPLVQKVMKSNPDYGDNSRYLGCFWAIRYSTGWTLLTLYIFFPQNMKQLSLISSLLFFLYPDGRTDDKFAVTTLRKSNPMSSSLFVCLYVCLQVHFFFPDLFARRWSRCCCCCCCCCRMELLCFNCNYRLGKNGGGGYLLPMKSYSATYVEGGCGWYNKV